MLYFSRLSGEIMKKKMLCIIFVFLVILSTVLCYIFIKEKKKQKVVDLKIAEKHNDFKKIVINYSKEREEFFDNYLNKLYVDDLKVKLPEIIESHDKYYENIKKMKDSSNYLKEKCIPYKGKDKNIRNKCDAFVVQYEQLINYYLNDFKEINVLINKYNTVHNDKLKLIELKEKEYIDIDGNKVFEGKE